MRAISPACLSDRTDRSAGKMYTGIMFYFYILQSTKDKAYYYGSTTNLKRRVNEHISGKVESTCNRLPLKLVYYEAYVTDGVARLRERQVKKSGSIRKTLTNRINKGH